MKSKNFWGKKLGYVLFKLSETLFQPYAWIPQWFLWRTYPLAGRNMEAEFASRCMIYWTNLQRLCTGSLCKQIYSRGFWNSGTQLCSWFPLFLPLQEKRTRKCTFPQKDNTPFSECLHKPGLVKSIFLVGRGKDDVKIQVLYRDKNFSTSHTHRLPAPKNRL